MLIFYLRDSIYLLPFFYQDKVIRDPKTEKMNFINCFTQPSYDVVIYNKSLLIDSDLRGMTGAAVACFKRYIPSAGESVVR